MCVCVCVYLSPDIKQLSSLQHTHLISSCIKYRSVVELLVLGSLIYLRGDLSGGGRGWWRYRELGIRKCYSRQGRKMKALISTCKVIEDW